MARRVNALRWGASINSLVARSLTDVKPPIVKSANMSATVKGMDMTAPSMLVRRGLTTETSKSQHRVEQYQQMGQELPSK